MDVVVPPHTFWTPPDDYQLNRDRDGSRKRRKVAKERTRAKMAAASRKRNRA